MADYRISLARPEITEADRRAVDRALRSTTLSRGPELDAFERAFAGFTGSRHAVGLSSGTAALHLGLLALGAGPGRRVITTPFSVPASVNPVLATGARPVFVDIAPDSRALDAGAVAAELDGGDLVLAVHPFGEPAPVTKLAALCRQCDAILLEDACEALGTVIDGRHAGRHGRWGAFGFYPNKQMTTGEGGMLICDDETLARRVRLLANHGRAMDGRWFDQELPGLNYRMSELAAALGRSQLSRLTETLTRRRRVAIRYRHHLGELDLRLPADAPGTSLFAYVVQLPDACDRHTRDRLIEELAANGIQASRYFAPLHLQPGLASLGYARGDFPVTESVADRSLALPFYSDLDERAISSVAETLRTALEAGS